MSEPRIPLEVAGIQQICKRLHMPTIAAQCARLAEQAIKEKQSHLIYLETLLEAELTSAPAASNDSIEPVALCSAVACNGVRPFWSRALMSALLAISKSATSLRNATCSGEAP